MSPDEERLMQLFQNRAGLKKAYADLKDEFHLLRDRLKQQEGATIRVQEQRCARRSAGRSEDRLRRTGVFSTARPVESLSSAAPRFRHDLTRQQEAREVAKHKADIEAANGPARGRRSAPGGGGGGGRLAAPAFVRGAK